MLKEINIEIERFKNKNIQIVPGFFFNQYDAIQKIYFYHNSRFQTGDVDDEGDRKYFLNVNKNPCKVFTKAIDFDTKDIRLLTVAGSNPQKTWFMERDLKFWMRDKQFGKTLNRIFKELPIFGSVVLKIVDGTPYFVDLRNFVVEQQANSIDDSNYILEVHNLTPEAFRKIGKEMKWEQAKIDEVIKLFHQMRDTSHIRLYERYGEVCEEDGQGNKTYEYRRTFCADVGVDEFDQYQNLVAKYPGIDLSSEKFEGHPYWEFHVDKIPGRWLGVGVVENLFEPQIRQNELANLQSKASYWAALRVFQTRDNAINRNLFTDVRNGEILNCDSEITQIDMSDRNLAFFNEEYRKWQNNRDELSFSYDAVQGERLPAGTTATQANISVTQTLSYFQQIQEDIAMDVKEMLYEVIIPRFAEEVSGEHILRIAGADLNEYAEMIKNDLVLKEVIRLAGLGQFPTEEEKEAIGMAIEESIKQGKEALLKIPKNFYQDIKYDVDIDITGESVDTRVRAATKFAIAQMVTADPTMTTDPFKRKLLMSYMEDGGINPNDFFGVETKTVENFMPPGRAGGGVSAPALNQELAGAASQTI